MIAALMLIAASHCADADYCPPIAVIRSAIAQRDRDWEERLNAGPQGDMDGAYIFARVPRIERISGVFCGARDTETDTVTCHAWVQYRRGRKLVMLRFAPGKGGGWKVETGLDVYHPL